MRINVSRALKTPGLTVAHHLVTALDAIDYLGRDIMFASPVAFDVECVYDGNAVCVKLTAESVS